MTRRAAARKAGHDQGAAATGIIICAINGTVRKIRTNIAKFNAGAHGGSLVNFLG